jgi:hypothetical protein
MKTLLTLIALTLITSTSFGIIKKKRAGKKAMPKSTSYHVGFQNVAISMPSKVLNGMPHFGVEVGFSVPLKKNAKKQRFTVGADGGYFFQKGLQSGTYVKPNIAYSFPITKKISLQTRIGAGLLVTNNLNKEFKQNESGVYKKVSPLNPQAMLSLAIQPNVNVYNSKKYRYDAYLRYEFAAQTPFSAISTLLPLTMLQLGITIKGGK